MISSLMLPNERGRDGWGVRGGSWQGRRGRGGSGSIGRWTRGGDLVPAGGMAVVGGGWPLVSGARGHF